LAYALARDAHDLPDLLESHAVRMRGDELLRVRILLPLEVSPWVRKASPAASIPVFANDNIRATADGAALLHPRTNPHACAR
jgi:hypothetical protein